MRSTVGEDATRSWWRRSWWLGVVLAAYLVWAASAQAQPFAYVSNDLSGSVSQYGASGGGLSPLTPATVPAGGFSAGVAVSPDGKSIYDVGYPNAGIFQYDVGSSGSLTPKTPANAPSGPCALGIALSPDGKSAYVTSYGSDVEGCGPSLAGAVLQYNVDPLTGALTAKTPATVAGGPGPLGVAVSPDGKSVYVADSGSNTVSQFDVGSGGVLTPKTPATVTISGAPTSIAVSPGGGSVYVAAGSALFQFDVGSDGALSPKAPASVPIGGTFGLAMQAIAVSPNDRSVYVANYPDMVSQFDIGPSGALTPKAPAAVATAFGADSVAVSPDGKSVYVANQGEVPNAPGSVSQYDVNPLTGALSPSTPATVPAGNDPVAIAITPLPRVPTSKEQCKNGGWRNYPQFKNQGDCVSFVENGK